MAFLLNFFSTILVSSFFQIKNSGSQGIKDSGENKIVFRDKGDYRIEYLIITYLFYPCYTYNGLRITIIRSTPIWLLKKILSSIFKQSFYTYTISGYSSKHSLWTVSRLSSRGPLYLMFTNGSYVSQYLSSYFVVWRSFSRRFHRKGSWEPYSLSSICAHFTWKLRWIKKLFDSHLFPRGS